MFTLQTEDNFFQHYSYLSPANYILFLRETFIMQKKYQCILLLLRNVVLNQQMATRHRNISSIIHSWSNVVLTLYLWGVGASEDARGLHDDLWEQPRLPPCMSPTDHLTLTGHREATGAEGQTWRQLCHHNAPRRGSDHFWLRWGGGWISLRCTRDCLNGRASSHTGFWKK